MDKWIIIEDKGGYVIDLIDDPLNEVKGYEEHKDACMALLALKDLKILSPTSYQEIPDSMRIVKIEENKKKNNEDVKRWYNLKKKR